LEWRKEEWVGRVQQSLEVADCLAQKRDVEGFVRFHVAIWSFQKGECF